MQISIIKKLYTGAAPFLLQVQHQVAEGSLVKVSGPSGAGKTTLLKILAGLVRADSGDIVFDDEPWLNTNQGICRSAQQRRVGFVFQDYALFPNMTVAQHLAFAGANAAWAQRLLQMGGLEAFAGSKPVALSGGQQQRAAILRALAGKPRLLLMDEPFSALDATTKTNLIAQLKTLIAEMGVTTFIVSHNQAELAAFEGEVLLVG